MAEKWAEQEPMACYWKQCSNQKRCGEFGSCVAASQAGGATFPTPGTERSRDYQTGWDDCLEAVFRLLGERFPRRAIQLHGRDAEAVLESIKKDIAP